MKYILTDVDDTVLKFADIFQEWLETRGIVYPDRLRDNPRHSSDIGELIHHFIENPDLIGNLPPEEDAIKVLPTLYENGWKFVAITAVPDNRDIVEARKENLEKVFGFKWENVHCVGLGGDKTETLKRYPQSIWVEDNHKNALVGASVGHKSFLLNRPSNSKYADDSITRIENWHEIASLIGGNRCMEN